MTFDVKSVDRQRNPTPDDLARYYELASKGDVQSQLTLAYGYLFGSFGKRDPVESMRWCSLALQKNVAFAKFLYGMYHFLGFGVPKDYGIAFRWWSEAAIDGDRHAQVNTAWAYSQGVGVDKDHREAFKWWLKSAQQGVPEAQFSVAQYYESGDGLANKDKTEACCWYLLAEMNGDSNAKTRLNAIRKTSGVLVENAKIKIQEWLQQNPLLDNKKWLANSK